MNNQDILFDSLLKEESLSENTLLQIDSYLYTLSNNILSKRDRSKLLEYKNILEQIPTDHHKKKAIVLYHLNRLGTYTYEDYSTKLSQRQRKYLNSLTKDILQHKRVLTTSISKESLDTIISLIDKNNIDILTLSIDELYTLLYTNNIISILDTIYLYNTNSILEENQENIGGGHKGGGM